MPKRKTRNPFSIRAVFGVDDFGIKQAASFAHFLFFLLRWTLGCVRARECGASGRRFLILTFFPRLDDDGTTTTTKREGLTNNNIPRQQHRRGIASSSDSWLSLSFGFVWCIKDSLVTSLLDFIYIYFYLRVSKIQSIGPVPVFTLQTSPFVIRDSTFILLSSFYFLYFPIRTSILFYVISCHVTSRSKAFDRMTFCLYFLVYFSIEDNLLVASGRVVGPERA